MCHYLCIKARREHNLLSPVQTQPLLWCVSFFFMQTHIINCVLVHDNHAVTVLVLLTVKAGAADSLRIFTWFQDTLAGLALCTTLAAECVHA